jgi:MFS family permease
MTVSVYTGMLVGALFWGFGADMIGMTPSAAASGTVMLTYEPGRKLAFNCSLFICSVFAIVAGASPNWIVLGLFVALSAFGAGGNLVLDASKSIPGAHGRPELAPQSEGMQGVTIYVYSCVIGVSPQSLPVALDLVSLLVGSSSRHRGRVCVATAVAAPVHLCRRRQSMSQSRQHGESALERCRTYGTDFTRDGVISGSATVLLFWFSALSASQS